VHTVLLLLLLFPLAGGVLNAVAGRYWPRRLTETVACAAALGALGCAAAALVLAGDRAHDFTFFSWIASGDFLTAMNVHYDPLAAVMALMVTFVASIIHLYSVAFMREESDYVRYFCYLNLFVFAMLVITVADSLIFVYLGWEGVGFCSYALIGFWYSNPANANAGRKAFICTRIGDVAFGIAIALFFVHFQHFSISYINIHAAALRGSLATLLALLLLAAAVGKSAQLPLTVWLPDAMAGPTPVSALIHAATMVTAGTYLLMRLFPVVELSRTAMLVIAVVGAVTTLYAAAAALAQRDIKRMLAYSTISQVGYMFLAVGAGDIVGGLFHLVSHAFFKALLFLAAGCVIQALAEEHNIFRMGNLKRHLPQVYWLFLAGAVSLSAFPLLGGFFSKDRILLATFIFPDATGAYKILWLIATVAAFLTPLYTFRVFFVAFPNRPEGRPAGEVHPIPRFMAWVLWPLAVCALGDGLLNLPGGFGKNFLGHYLAIVPGARPDLGAGLATEWAMGLTSASLVLVAMLLAYYLYGRRPVREPALVGFQEFLFSGLYLDRLYATLFVRPYQALSVFCWQADDRLNEGIVAGAKAAFRPYWAMAQFIYYKVDEIFLDDGIVKAASSVEVASRNLGRWATGRLSTYLAMLLLGLTIFLGALGLSWYLG
jgi:NADH-quinone oxidoreductase subunit L